MSDYSVVSLNVNNHPGVMSHIVGLFTRRGFNLEGILCGRLGNPKISKIYLLVKKNDQLEQIIKQLDKLYDVLFVTVCKECNIETFDNIHKIIGDNTV